MFEYAIPSSTDNCRLMSVVQMYKRRWRDIPICGETDPRSGVFCEQTETTRTRARQFVPVHLPDSCARISTTDVKPSGSVRQHPYRSFVRIRYAVFALQFRCVTSAVYLVQSIASMFRPRTCPVIMSRFRTYHRWHMYISNEPVVLLPYLLLHTCHPTPLHSFNIP